MAVVLKRILNGKPLIMTSVANAVNTHIGKTDKRINVDVNTLR